MARSREPALYDSRPRFIGANSGDDTFLRSSQGPAGLTVLHSREGVDWFVDGGFLFVQTMKWTLAHQFDTKLSTRQRRLAVDHSVQAHLLRGIE
jgi:hypothetical protein